MNAPLRVGAATALLALLSLGTGCDSAPRDGTYVGNPSKHQIRLAPIVGLEVLEAATESMSVQYLACGEGLAVIVDEDEVDLLGRRAFEVPPGRWCAVVVDVEAPIVVTMGSIREELRLVVEVQPSTSFTLWADQPIEIDGQPLVLELGAPGWLDTEELDVDEEEARYPAESEVSRLLAAEISATSALFEDLDNSGTLEPAERDEPPLAAADRPVPAELAQTADTGPPPPRISVDGCGCGAPGRGPGGLAVAVALLGLLSARRRR